jgi:AraC family transcriptional regulator of adaptative response / DNA-3-methyladenine glycosylase II
MRVLDAEVLERAVRSRDPRFDGWFVFGVTSTGIYCRPSCPATPARRDRLRFFPSVAAAQLDGFRACKRCRPDATPGSPEWRIRTDVVARAMRLIADGVVDRDGVGGLARRLGYSERHLGRILTGELGAGPLALARAQRAQTARALVEGTDLAFTAVAFAAGFGSVRQFNDTIRSVFGVTPSELRAARRHERGGPTGGAPGVSAGWVSLRLPARAPFAGGELLGFLGARAVPGVESWDGTTYARTLELPHGHGAVVLRPSPDAAAVDARLAVADWRDVGPAVERCRRLLDLDADPAAVDAVLGADPLLAPGVVAVPGRRSPGSVDGAELAVRAVVGQQVSVAGARTITGRLVALAGTDLDERLAGWGHEVRLTHVFPSPARLAALDPAVLPLPRARAATLHRLAAALATGDVTVDVGADRHDLVERLVAIRGIGPWTASYVLMRGLGDPDVFLPTDLGVRRALERLGEDGSPRSAAARAERWRPWRSYALHHVWATPNARHPGVPDPT